MKARARVATKGEAKDIARRIFGAGTYTVARRTPWNWWKVEVCRDGADQSHVLLEREAPSLGEAYGSIVARLKPQIQSTLDLGDGA